MRRSIATGCLVWAAFLGFTPASHHQEPSLQGMTPIITVESIEPCLPFWTEALGFEVTASVPGDDGLDFAMLQRENVELMYQTRASIDADLGASGAPHDLGAELAVSTATLFVQVDALDPVLSRLERTVEVVVPRRQTDYGMDELFVRAPCGSLVGFAAPIAPGD